MTTHEGQIQWSWWLSGLQQPSPITLLCERDGHLGHLLWGRRSLWSPTDKPRLLVFFLRHSLIGERGLVMWSPRSPFSRDPPAPIARGRHIRLCQNAACHPFISSASHCHPSALRLCTSRPHCIPVICWSCSLQHWCFYLLGLSLPWR